jgi:UDP-glucose 4-epimerase
MVKSFEHASGKTIPYVIAPRRDGDLPAFWADPSLAKQELGWAVSRDLDCMMRDTWNWQKNNPNGYKE